MPNKKCKTLFKDFSVTKEEFKSWLGKSDDSLYAICKACHKSFSIAVGGINTVRQDAKGKCNI